LISEKREPVNENRMEAVKDAEKCSEYLFVNCLAYHIFFQDRDSTAGSVMEV
jgi:hypothetical protein